MLKTLVKDVFIYGITGAITRALHFFLVPLYTRLFLPAEYGVVDLVTVISGVFSLIATLQMESAMGRYYSEADDKERKNKVCSTGLIAVIISSVLVFILFKSLIPSFSDFFLSGGHQDTLSVASFTIILSAIYGYLINLLRFIRKPFLYAIVVILQISTTVITILFLVINNGLGINGIFYGQIVGFILAIILLLLSTLKEGLISTVWDIKIFNKLIKFGLPLLPAVIMGGSVTFISRFFMLNNLSLSEIGLYSIAMKIASVMMLLDEAIRMTWAPFLYENIKKENHGKTIRKIFLVSSLSIFGIVVILWLFLQSFVDLIVGKSYFGILFISMIMILDFGLKSIVQLLLIGPVIQKRTLYNSLITLVGLIAYIIALWVLVPALGINGAAFSSLISTLIVLSVSWIITERLYYIGHSVVLFILPLIILISILIIILI